MEVNRQEEAHQREHIAEDFEANVVVWYSLWSFKGVILLDLNDDKFQKRSSSAQEAQGWLSLDIFLKSLN